MVVSGILGCDQAPCFFKHACHVSPPTTSPLHSCIEAVSLSKGQPQKKNSHVFFGNSNLQHILTFFSLVGYDRCSLLCHCIIMKERVFLVWETLNLDHLARGLDLPAELCDWISHLHHSLIIPSTNISVKIAGHLSFFVVRPQKSGHSYLLFKTKFLPSFNLSYTGSNLTLSP